MSGGAFVAHPGVQHSYQTALALQERALLRRYMTGGFYYKKTGLLERSVRILPERQRARLERELLRRRLDALDDRLISASSVLDFVHAAADRVLPPNRLGLRVFHWRSARFKKRAARMVEELRPSVVICYDDGALGVFDAAHRVGAFCLLDQSIGPVTQLAEQFRAAGLPLELDANDVANARAEALAADAIVTSSRYVEDGLRGIGVPHDRILVLPYGADISRFEPPETRAGRPLVRALYVGHISHRKGVRYVLEAFDSLALPNLELVMVGKRMSDVPGFDTPRERFQHLGPVPNRELTSVYQRADVFVQMSIHEGSTTTIHEALASGLPVVTTPNSGSLVRDGIEGFIVPPRDSVALADRLRLLARDEALRERMGRAARVRAESFTWRHYRERYGALVEDLVRSAPGEWTRVVEQHRRRLAAILAFDRPGGTAGDRNTATGNWSEE